MTKETDRPVHYVEEKVERGKEKNHSLVDNPSSLLRVLLLLGMVVLCLGEPDEGELDPVDNDGPEDEQEVDENPKGKSRQALRNLERK